MITTRAIMVALSVAISVAPARAEPFLQWLDRVGVDSPQAKSIRADAQAELAGLGRYVLDWRPSITINGELKNKQDSTLPVVQFLNKNAATMQVQQLVTDWGASSTKRDADAARADAVRWRTEKRIKALIGDAARTYIATWKAKENAAAIKDAVDAVSGIMARQKTRKVAESEIRSISGDLADLQMQLRLAEREHGVSKATLSRYGRAAAIVAPTVPYRKPDQEGSEDAKEALATAVASERDAVAARLARLPKINAFASYEQVRSETYPDVTYGVRVTLDLFDKAGTDLDRLKALAEQNAAKAKEFAAQETYASVLAAYERQDQHTRDAIKAMTAMRDGEVQRMKDQDIKLKDGKATPQEVIQAVRRMVAIKRMLTDAVGDLALARVQVR